MRLLYTSLVRSHLDYANNIEPPPVRGRAHYRKIQKGLSNLFQYTCQERLSTLNLQVYNIIMDLITRYSTPQEGSLLYYEH